MSEEDLDTNELINMDEDIFKILIATDNHLGYAEDDPIRSADSFNSFEEILQIAVEQDVDFLLLGGDLFHYAQPSPYCMYKCMDLLKQYCLGDKPVSVELLEYADETTKNYIANYENPNLNVGLPVFSIHGNHDDPTGQKHTSALDILSSSGLLNYFGKCQDYENIEIKPLLLRKGESKLALYGLSHVKDERLGRLFVNKKVKLLSPEGDDWFHLLVWHQNRVARGPKNYVACSALPDFLDLVIWGHEHDCRIDLETESGCNAPICQPGSSVATSLAQGESIPKKVAVLEICKRDFKLTNFELKSVRPFQFAEISLLDMRDGSQDKDSKIDNEETRMLVTAKINEMIKEAKRMGQNRDVSEKPLIRLIVKYKHISQTFNVIRFGQSFIGKVANPENMVQFQLFNKGARKKKTDNDDLDFDDFVDPRGGDRVEDLVTRYFEEENKSLAVFPVQTLNEVVKKYVTTNDRNAINDVVDEFLSAALKQVGKDLPDITETDEFLTNYKNKIEAEAVQFVNNILENPDRKTVPDKVTAEHSGDEEEPISIADSDDEISVANNTSIRGRGRGRARRASGTSRGRGASTSRAAKAKTTRADNSFW